MRTDSARKLAGKSFASGYWDIPEVAMLLRMVMHINIGGTVALGIWLATMIVASAGGSAVTGDASPRRYDCRCEKMVLIPIPARARQIVNAHEWPHS